MKKLKRSARKKAAQKNNPKTIIIITVIACVFSAILLLAYDPPVTGPEVPGSVQSEYKQTLRQHVVAHVVVKLDTGQLVEVQANRMGVFKKGRRVVLQEMKGLIFKRKQYRFLRYAED